MPKIVQKTPFNFSKAWRGQSREQRYIAGALLLLGFAAIGIFGLGVSRADTFKITAEAETGTIAGMAVPGDTTGASGGASVKFGAEVADSGGDCVATTGFPGSACTGIPTGTALTANDPAGGYLTITTANAVVENQDINGCVVIQAAGVSIKNSKITCGQLSAVSIDGTTAGASVTIEDTEIICAGSNTYGVNGGEVTARRLNVHGCKSGFMATGSLTLEDSFIHNMAASSGGVANISAGVALMKGGTTANSIKHNTIHAKGASAAIAAVNNIPNTSLNQNLLAGGTYALQCPVGAGTNFVVTDNHFSIKFYPTVGSTGPWQNCDDETTVTGNVYHESGTPL